MRAIVRLDAVRAAGRKKPRLRGPDNEETSSVPGHSEEETSSPRDPALVTTLGEESILPLLTKIVFPAPLRKSLDADVGGGKKIAQELTQYLLAHKQSFHARRHFRAEDSGDEASTDLTKALRGEIRLLDLGLTKADIAEAALALYGDP